METIVILNGRHFRLNGKLFGNGLGDWDVRCDFDDGEHTWLKVENYNTLNILKDHMDSIYVDRLELISD